MQIPRILKTSSKSSTIALTAAALAIASLSSASSANYYLGANIASTDDANNPALWWSNTDGTGTHPGTMAGNDFFSNGFAVRFITNGTTFGGNSLTLNLYGNIKTAGTSTTSPGYTVPVLNAVAAPVGATFSVGLTANSGQANTYFNVGTLNVASGLNFGVSANGGGASPYFYLTINTLTGAGTLDIGANVGGNQSLNGNTIFLSVANTSAYTGNIKWGNTNGQNVILNFDSAFTSTGSLTARANDRIALDQNLTFSAVSLGGTSLAAGTYDYTYLKNNFSNIFTDGGSGSITVVPEPGTYGLLFVGLLGLAVWRRAKSQKACA